MDGRCGTGSPHSARRSCWRCLSLSQIIEVTLRRTGAGKISKNPATCFRVQPGPAIAPPFPANVKNPGTCPGAGYLDCWNSYWAWTKTDDFKKAMRDIVMKDDFLKDNYLSSEFRVPVTLLQTNACSPLATNALKDNIWDNFSSTTYKELPSVGAITVQDPLTGEDKQYQMPGGGRGFTRPASLVSLWSTSPYLLNNSVGGLYP